MNELKREKKRILMQQEVEIRPAQLGDLEAVARVLSDWLSEKDVKHYIKSIREILSSPSPSPKFDSHYFVATIDEAVVGIGGYRTPNPKLRKFTITEAPAELCMLYVADNHRGGKGVGTKLLNHIVVDAHSRGYTELIVRSSERFAITGWGFYDKKGFHKVGELLPPESAKRSRVWIRKMPASITDDDLKHELSINNSPNPHGTFR